MSSSLSSSKILIQGIGYDVTVGPRSTGPSQQQQTNSQQTGSPQQQSSSTKNKLVPTSSIYDRNLHRAKHEISLSSLSFLFMEMVSMNLSNSKSLIELERKLNNLGYTVGVKFLELTSLRENFNNNVTSSGKSNTSKREIRILEVLHFITTTIWKSLFDKPADNLEKSSESETQYMIIDNQPLLMRYVSVPKEYENLNCEAFIAGVLEGILDSSFFKCEVSAHTVPMGNFSSRTVYLIDFDECVVKRDQRHSRR